jgi:hypothetical protein
MPHLGYRFVFVGDLGVTYSVVPTVGHHTGHRFVMVGDLEITCSIVPTVVPLYHYTQLDPRSILRRIPLRPVGNRRLRYTICTSYRWTTL